MANGPARAAVQSAADRHAEMANARGLGVMHWTAFIPWAAVRVVPTFLAAPKLVGFNQHAHLVLTQFQIFTRFF